MSLTKDEQYFFDYMVKNSKMYLVDHTKGIPTTWGLKDIARCCGAHQVLLFPPVSVFNGMLMELSNEPRPELIEERVGIHSPGTMESHMQHVSIPIEEKGLDFKFMNLRLLRKQIT